MKKLKIYICIISILIILILGIIVCLKLYDNINEYDTNTIIQNKTDMGVGEFSEEKIEEVNQAEWMQIGRCINGYLDVINENNSAYFGTDENNNYVKVITDDAIKERIYDMLSNKYINDNNITLDNLNEFVELIQEDQTFTILSVKKVINDNSNQYITSGFTQTQDEFVADKIFIVNFNLKDSAFSIEPIEDIREIDDVQVEDTEVSRNENNVIPQVLANGENLAKEYFNIVKRMTIVAPQYAYNYLNTEYSEKRFGSVEKFENFVDANKEELNRLVLQKFQVNNYDDKTEYLLVDQYNNIYTIDVNANTVTDYTVKLDTYTIISDNFKEKYDSSNEQYKVAMNIDKWIQMLNTRDYANAYNVLDETFRNGNWGSEENFEQFMRENFPLHYDVEYTTYSNEGSTYVQQINLTDITGETEGTIALNIIMQLKDNYEFVMSFSIQQ